MLRASLLFSLVVPLIVIAQIWCPPNATWKWNTSSFEREGRTERHYVGDTLIDSRTAQRIHVTGFSVNTIGSPDTLFIDQYRFTSIENDVVLLWSIWNGPPEWDTLYWFGAVPGDRWYAPGDDGECGPTPAGMHQVMDTATVIIDGVSLKELQLSAVDEFGTPFGDLHSLTERIGLANGSFNLLSGCIPVNATETLHCYTDIDIDLVTPEGEFGCSSLVGLNEYSDENVILAFPNPGAEQFTIQWPNETFHSVLMDQAGREVLRKSNASGAIRFDTSQLAKGAYQVITTNEKGDRSFSRWVKQ
ncbi:MAG: T9SS type A sorting domain-containing protein [Flavobacteriales bacterium]